MNTIAVTSATGGQAEPDDLITQGQASLSISGAVRKEWEPSDWTGDGNYYRRDLTQEDLVWRLLMGVYGHFGNGVANESADIPSGNT